MTCMNWTLTVLSVLIFIFAVWPGYGTEVTTQWVVGISAVLILIVAWSGVECKPCAVNNKKGKKGKGKKDKEEEEEKKKK